MVEGFSLQDFQSRLGKYQEEICSLEKDEKKGRTCPSRWNERKAKRLQDLRSRLVPRTQAAINAWDQESTRRRGWSPYFVR